MTLTSHKAGLRVVTTPAVEASDGDLCRRFLAGDEAAFGELLRRHQEPVFRLVRRYAGSADDARDLAQRAFLQAFEAARRTLPRFTTSEPPFRAWLLRIAINLGKNAARDRKRWKLVSVDLAREPEPGASAHAALERAEAEALTRRAVLELPPRQREVFVLRIDAGLPFAEVAETLGITETNAKTHFHYAVKRLRDEVQRLVSDPARPKEATP